MASWGRSWMSRSTTTARRRAGRSRIAVSTRSRRSPTSLRATGSWSGRVSIDGHDRTEIPREVFRNTVAMVDQKIALFEGTVAENITMWDPTLPEARIVAAAKDACLHEEIAGRPDGYRQPIQEGERNFSGGERQLVLVARALCQATDWLLMDEPTAFLDLSHRLGVLGVLRERAAAGAGVLVVSHDLSLAARSCDRLVLLREGAVVAEGAPREVLTPDSLRAVFDVEGEVLSASDGSPVVAPRVEGEAAGC